MSTPRKNAPKKPRTPLQALVRLILMQPIWAVPFALFFGALYGGERKEYLGFYVVSLVFAYTISLAIWATEHFIVPRFGLRETEQGMSRVWTHAMLYMITSVAATFLGALIIRLTLIHDFLGSPRAFISFTMFTLLFTVLFSAVSYALFFYQKAIERARSEQELNLARRIQRSFLLTQFPAMPRLDVHAVNVSSKQVSGDFYDVVPAGDGRFLVAIADVAGKGVPAALLTSMLQASLRTQAHHVPSVAAILANINQLVYRSTAVNQFATFFLACMDEQRLALTYSNAGHNYPVVYRRSGERVELERGGTVVGILEDAKFEEGDLTLLPGDRVLLYTDGINEAANAEGELYGEERIHALMSGLPASMTARESVERLLAGVRGFLDGVEPGDDMTVLVLRVVEDSTPR